MDDFARAAGLHEAEGTEKGKLMRNRTLALAEHQAKVGHAHLSNAKRGKNLHARGIGKNRKKIRKIGNHFILRQVILDHALIVLGENERGALKGSIHIFHHIGHIKSLSTAKILDS